MGFELKIVNGNLGPEAEIRSVDSSNLPTSFIDIVKQCVAKKVLDITLNVDGIEPFFPQIRESVIRLDQFLTTKGHKLKLIGDKLSPNELEGLRRGGVAIIRTDIASVSAGLKSLIKVFEQTGQLPTNPLLTSDADVQRNEFNSLRDRYEKLEAELKSFRAHKDVMMKSKISLDSAKKDLGKLQASSQKAKTNLEEITKRKAELSRLTMTLDEEEKRFAAFVKRLDQEGQKKESEFKKEISAENTRFQKIESEFGKRSEARQAEIKKLETKTAEPIKAPPAESAKK